MCFFWYCVFPTLFGVDGVELVGLEVGLFLYYVVRFDSKLELNRRELE